MNCPICEQEIKDYQEYHSEGHLEEEHAKCSDGDHFYSFDYSYGNYEETIGTATFYWTYSSTTEERQERSLIRKVVLYYTKQLYLKKVGVQG